MHHTHSTFSFHAGTCSVPQLVTRAKTLGLPALALTDTNRMSGLILFYRACHDAGIKPILGVELTEPGRPHENIVLLAKNADGYGDLCEIITKRHLDSSSFRFRTIFSRHWHNLLFISGFNDLLELISHTPNRPQLYAELINNSPITRERSRAVVTCAQRLGLPLVATNDSYFLDAADWEIHRILVAIGANSTLSRLKPEEYAGQHAYLRSSKDMERLFPNHLEALRNALIIADQCTVTLKLDEWIMPRIEVPSGYTPVSYLTRVAYEGLERNYAGTPAYARAREIQEMELKVIDKLGYPSYFLIVKDIRDWANHRFAKGYRKPRDSTILRGSAANSITFYNIGVSDLDPIRYDLYFQRFLNEDRASPPDADLDFGWDEREEALEYMVKRWGRDRVAITCTTNHFRGRAAFRETAKVFGYSEEQITALMKEHRGEVRSEVRSVEWGVRSGREQSAVKDQRSEVSPSTALGDHGQQSKSKTSRFQPSHHSSQSRVTSHQSPDTELQHIQALAARIRGKPRFLGQHPGGVLVTNDPIWRHVACESTGGRVITQIDMHNGIDDLGLIKFDLLGNGSLSVLRDALAQIAEQGHPDPHVEDLDKCYADPMTADIIKNGRTRGIFYIESPAQTRLNKKSQVETFEELTITSSLIRPAGASYTATFIERHRAAKAGLPRDWEFLHPSLEPILRDSHDVCAFQEDVTKICHQVAGLGYKRADKIRKMMNSLHDGETAPEVIEQTAREFISGCMGHSGLSLDQACELWKRVSSFTGFSFCKSHSASYAQLSFKCSYLKAHYPAQFLSAVISNNHGFYATDVYLDEARRWGVRILPMSINDSRVGYVGCDAQMRPGFMHIRGLRDVSMERIVVDRAEKGPFRDIVGFIERLPTVHRAEIESLILVGGFDGQGYTQPEALYLLDGLYKRLAPDAPTLFDTGALNRRIDAHLSNYTLTQRCLNELHLLGFMLSGNILEILELHPAARNAVRANQIKHHTGQRIKVFGTVITRRMHVTENDRRSMMFLTIQDATEALDIILWPDVYDRHADIIEQAGPFEVWGRVIEEYDTYCIVAERIKSVAWTPNQIDFDLASKKLANSFTKPWYTYEDIPRVAAA